MVHIRVRASLSAAATLATSLGKKKNRLTHVVLVVKILQIIDTLLDGMAELRQCLCVVCV